MVSRVHAATKTRKMTADLPSAEIDQYPISINTIMEEIRRSPEVSPDQITQLEEKCDVVHE